MARAVANVFSLAKDKSTVLLALNYHNGSKANLVTVAFAWGKKKQPQNKRCRQQKVWPEDATAVKQQRTPRVIKMCSPVSSQLNRPGDYYMKIGLMNSTSISYLHLPVLNRSPTSHAALPGRGEKRKKKKKKKGAGSLC